MEAGVCFVGWRCFDGLNLELQLGKMTRLSRCPQPRWYVACLYGLLVPAGSAARLFQLGKLKKKKKKREDQRKEKKK